MRFLLPQGIGDSIWAAFKLQDVAKKHDSKRIDVYIACWTVNNVECRALDFIKRFGFIDSAQMCIVPHLPDKAGPVLDVGPIVDSSGYYRYMSDGKCYYLPQIDYVLMPNAPLERGIRLENWLPEYETNWDIMDDYRFSMGELKFADQFKDDYAIFFLGSEEANTYGTAGHNRGGIWRPKDWIDLGNELTKKYGLKIIVVGAEYDRSYFDKYIATHVTWTNLIGDLPINKTLAVCKNAKLVVSYQSGIGIVSHYLGVPLAIFWRQKGDSICGDYYLSFEEEMASAWANPSRLHYHLPLYYGRHDVAYILQEIENRKWL